MGAEQAPAVLFADTTEMLVCLCDWLVVGKPPLAVALPVSGVGLR